MHYAKSAERFVFLILQLVCSCCGRRSRLMLDRRDALSRHVVDLHRQSEGGRGFVWLVALRGGRVVGEIDDFAGRRKLGAEGGVFGLELCDHGGTFGRECSAAVRWWGS